MKAPEGYEHLDPEFWAKVEERDGCWIYRSNSTSTPTYKGVSILIYVSGSCEPKNRHCRHRKCVRPGHFSVGVSNRDEDGGLAGLPRQWRVRSGAQFSQWYSQC